MNKKLVLIASLALPIIFLATWVGTIQYKISKAPEVIIRAEGFDPRSLISGHYLNLRLNWQGTNCRQFSDNLCHPGRFNSIYDYYLPENDAIYLDKLIRQGNLKLELVFAYPKSKKPHLKMLLINSKPWAEWLLEQHKKQK